MPFIYQMLLYGAVFACVVCVSWLALTHVTPDQWQQRIRMIRGGYAANTDGLARLKALALAVGRLSGEADDGALQRKLVQAGFRSPSALAGLLGMRVLLGVAAMLLTWLLLPALGHRALCVLLATAAAFYLPNVVLARRVERRQREIAQGLPEALDLMTIAVDAGLGLDAAVMRVTNKIGMQAPALRTELELTWMEINAGVARPAALLNLAKRTGVEDINLLVALLNSAEQLGVPVSGALHNFSASLRLKRQQRAEEQAGKMPVKLLFPLVFLVLPVLVIVLIGPSVMQIGRALVSLSGGG